MRKYSLDGSVHAALGDRSRLAIADRLMLGDVAPGELADMFGMPSNLLAHHLRVLGEAGLIERVRSETFGVRTFGWFPRHLPV